MLRAPSVLAVLLALAGPLRAQPVPAATEQLVVVTTAGWGVTTGTLRRYERAGPRAAWRRVGADVAVVVGTSAIVYPAAGLPELALAEGVPVIEVNPERTPLSDSATISLRETAATALPELLQRLPALLG